MLQLEFDTDLRYKEEISTSFTSKFIDTIALYNEINSKLDVLWKSGFVNVFADTVVFNGNKVSTTIHTGKRYDSFFINRIIYESDKLSDKEFSINNKTLNAIELGKLKEKIVQFYEQNAYPFVSVKLDSIYVTENLISGNLYINPHLQINFDSINIIGSIKLNKKYLYKYIGIKSADAYNENVVKNINNRIQELPFVNQTKPYKIIFTKEYTKLLLYLDKKKANKFDGFLGFLPNEKTGRVNFTGQLSIKLLNTISHGETIELEWRKLQPLTQDLKTNIIYPYIFNLPFGIEHNLKLYRRDTTFIDVSNSLGIQYILKGGNYMKIFISKRNINLINTTQYEFAATLPEYADVSHTAYGLSFNSNNTDYKLNPRKGFKTVLQASVGTKQIRKNLAINPAVYDGLILNTQQYLVQGNAGYFFPIMKKSTFLIDAKFAKIIGRNIFTNELFRIGGLISLRGFDEESINATAYVIPNIEYRYLFDKNSAVFMFANAAYYENLSRGYRVFDTPYGFGTGITFETKAGIFSLTYALGKQFNNPILIKNAKIHFGLVSIF